jgi:hypothetical protein
VVEHLPSKNKAMSSNPNTAKKTEKRAGLSGCQVGGRAKEGSRVQTPPGGVEGLRTAKALLQVTHW